MERNDLEYVGFWPRVWAALIDTVLVAFILGPIVSFLLARLGFGTGSTKTSLSSCVSSSDLGLLVQSCLLGLQSADADSGVTIGDVLADYILPAAAIILFWIYRQATPGKMAISARIVDASTGDTPSKAQLLGRYLGYYVSLLPLCLGLIWVAFDPRKQGWHDKLAGTVVVRSKTSRSTAVTFND